MWLGENCEELFSEFVGMLNFLQAMESCVG